MPTPIESYNSSVLYTADGLTSVFPFPFPYQNAADIFVSKNDVDQAGSFTITGGTNVSLSPMPAAGARIKIYRKTGHSGRRVDFTDGATITESDLDTAAVQHFYMGQEGYDLAKSLVNTVGDVAAAVQICTDAKNSSYASQIAALDSRNEALNAYNLAAAQASNASGYASAALGSATSASGNAAVASSYKIAAENARDTAAAAAVTATAGAATATTKANDASISASFALSSKNDAALSATDAYNSKIAAEVARDEAVAAAPGTPTSGAGSISYTSPWVDWSVAASTLTKYGTTVRLSAYIEATGTPTDPDNIAFVIPAGYRPASPGLSFLPATYFDSTAGEYRPCAATILPNGSVVLYSTTASGSPLASGNLVFIHANYLAA